MTDKVVGIYGEVGIANMKRTLRELKTLRADLTKTQRQLDSLKTARAKEKAQSNSDIARARRKNAEAKKSLALTRAETAYQRKRLKLNSEDAGRASIDKRYAQAKRAFSKGGSKAEFDEKLTRINRDMNDMIRMREDSERKLIKLSNKLIADKTRASKRDAAELIRAEKAASAIRARRTDAAVRAQNKFNIAARNAGLSGKGSKDPEAYARFGKELSNLNAKMMAGVITTGVYNQEISDLGRRMKIAGKSSLTLSQRIGGLRRMMLAAAGAYTVFAAAMAIEKTGMAFEGGGIMMEAVLGADAPEMMKFLRQEARRLGIDLARSQKSFSKFIASTKGLDYTNDQLKEMYSSISEAAVVFNLSQDNVDGLMKAFEQMAGKGQVMAEELKNQIGDRLFGSLERAAKAAGMTRKELIKAMELGQVDVKDFLPEFLRILREEAAPGLAKALETTKVAKDRMANDFEDLKNTVFVNGFGDVLTATYNFLGDLMAALKPIASFMTGLFAGFFESFMWAFQGIAAVFGDISDLMGPEVIKVFGEIGRVLGYVAAFLLAGPLIAGLKLLGNVLRPIASILTIITDKAIILGRAMGLLSSVARPAAAASGQAGKITSMIGRASRGITAENAIRVGATANLAGTAYKSIPMDISLTPEASRILKVSPRKNLAQELDRGTK